MRKRAVLSGYIFYCRSMLPDVIDEFMISTGERKDAIFYSFYVFFNKLAAGLGLGISQVALQLVLSVCPSVYIRILKFCVLKTLNSTAHIHT